MITDNKKALDIAQERYDNMDEDDVNPDFADDDFEYDYDVFNDDDY